MDFSKYVPISKVDEDKRMVYGYASTPDLDSQGERVSIDAVKKALPSYMSMPTIREMHQPKAAGLTKEAKTSEKGLFIGAKIVADDAWKLVKERVYNGFSIGGRVRKKVEDMITDLDLTEISLVDVPANRNAVFTLVKREGAKLVDTQSGEELPQWVAEQQAMIRKHTMSGLIDKEVNNMEKKTKKPEEVVEEKEEVEAEDSPQAPEETPEAPEKEEEEAEEKEEEATEVSEESPETVVDEVKETADMATMKKLEKLEKALVTPKASEEDKALAKLEARFDSQIAKVANILEGLAERVEKIEAVAAPVKAKPSYLVERGGSNTEDTKELSKLKAELADLDQVRKSNLEKYQREGLGEKALELYDAIRKLEG